MKRSPFTQLCLRVAAVRETSRADLHLHTNFSDGTQTPAEIVARALRVGLKAIAITDHDTLGAIEPARSIAASRLEIIAGVEITAEFAGREVHLLGYFIDPADSGLGQALSQLQTARRDRLVEMARRLRTLGVSVDADVSALPDHVSLGRRHLARILIARGFSRTIHGAFTKWLGHAALADVPRRRLSAPDAIRLVRSAGGVASLAHPPAEFGMTQLQGLRELGLQAVECVYPWPTRSHERRLRDLAAALGLAITGGSDCHDAGTAARAVGSRTVTGDELDRIRALAALRCESAAPSCS